MITSEFCIYLKAFFVNRGRTFENLRHLGGIPNFFFLEREDKHEKGGVGWVGLM